jgi:hypothetical protein
MGRVKGAGTDCLMMPAEVYEASGVIPHLEIPFYPADWNLSPRCGTVPRRHSQAASRFFASAAATPMGAIVVEWPRIIHTQVAVEMIYGDATQPKLASRNRVFSIYSLTSL